MFFSKHVSKTICLKKNILTKMSAVYQRVNEVADFQCTARSFTKKEALVRLYGETLKILMYIQEKLKVQFKCLKVFPCKFIGPHTEVFPHGIFEVALSKISESFLQGTFGVPFLTKWESCNLQVATLLRMMFERKIYRTNF